MYNMGECWKVLYIPDSAKAECVHLLAKNGRVVIIPNRGFSPAHEVSAVPRSMCAGEFPCGKVRSIRLVLARRPLR